MMVKICGITNREDALAAAQRGAAAIGFNFWPRSPRYIHPEAAAAIAGELPVSVWKVGVFVAEAAETVAKTAREIGLDIVQIYGGGEAPSDVRVWRAVAVDDGFRAQRLGEPGVEAFLLDAPAGEEQGGTGRHWDWSRAAGAAARIVVAGGLDADNVGAAIEAARPWGVDACSRLESSPGKKDHVKMAAFLKAALREAS